MAIGSATDAAAAQGGTAAARTSLSATFDQFLKMLTTQMKYQDPLSPMDSTQFTQQLVSFSQVEQQLATNDKLTELVDLQRVGGLQGSLGFIGLKVEAQTPYFTFEGEPVDLAYGFDKQAGEAKISIVNSAGTVVATPTAETAAGRHELVWDGKDANGNLLPEGAYVLVVEAVDTNGGKLSPWTTVSGIASGVDTTSGSTQILVNGMPVDQDRIVAAWTP